MSNIRTNCQDDHPLPVGFVGRVDECRESLMSLVSKGQVEIHNYPNARSVLRLTAVNRIALWVIEIELPDMSGLDLIEMIRDRLQDSTVCMIGATYRQTDEARAYRAGATIYASRPLESTWLISCVELLLGDLRSGGVVGYEDSASSECGQAEIDSNIQTPAELCGGDNSGQWTDFAI